jgi:membrane-bound serine protease (ClpP class)
MRKPHRRTDVRRARAWSGPLAAGLGLLLALSCLPTTARAENNPIEGLFITVPNPITSDVTNRVKETTTRAVERFRAADAARPADGRHAFKIVYDFNPNNGAGSSPDFGACYELARYLLALQDITTIAFVHGELSRHTVLPVLACKELVMSADAKLGPVQKEGTGRPTETELQAYREIITGRKLSPALILKLLDRDMEVMEGTRNGSVTYLSRAEIPDAKGFVLTKRDPVVGKGVGSYTRTQAQEFGLCRLGKETRQEVAEVYQMPANSLREDPLMGRNPVAWRVVVSGPVTKTLQDSLTRRIRRAIGTPDKKANVIILQLECSGGDTEVAHYLAKFLRDLKDDKDELPVKTVAYIPGRAPDTATILALGCTEIVMHKDAEIGDFSNYVGPPGEAEDENPEKTNLRLAALMQLAQEQGYSPLLVKGMFMRQLTLYQAVSKKGATREWRLLTEKELDADRDRWDPILIKAGGPDGKLLVLPAEKAKQVGLAWDVVEGKTPAEGLNNLYEKEGLKDVHTAGNDWLDDLTYFLRLPGVRIFLFLLGFTCLILELKIPGATLPGVIAAICFVIFFWAQWQSQSAGLMLLAVLLFILGLVLMGLEVFVMPGVGVVGISGAILVVVSLTLVTLEKKPETTQEWMQVGTTLSTFIASMIGAVVAAFAVAWYLPHIPYFNRLLLKPPTAPGQEVDELHPDLLKPAASALLGAIGVAVTPLRPAGKVKFGEEFLDVLAEGEYIVPGTRVQVIQIEGNRIVVKEV